MRRGETRKETKAAYYRAVIGFCLALTLIAVTAVTALAAPKRIATAKPGNCAACHGDQKVLPPDHKDTKPMAFQNCLECHAKTGSASLRGNLPLGHTHRLAGVTCASCHGKTKKPQPVKMKQCVTCHDTDKLAEKTANVKPANPHETKHYGKDLDCNVCHRQHEKPENFCSQCHKFDFVVP